MIILDTNVLSALMSSTDRVVRWVGSVHPDELATTTITRAEIVYGVARLPEGRRKDALGNLMAQVFARVQPDRWLPFDAAAADRYGELVADRDAVGRRIQVADAQIASIAFVRGATLASRNVKDFQDCGIKVVNPFE